MNKLLRQHSVIEGKIYLIRGRRVMLDKDLAVLYGVKTIALRQQVKRNTVRFPKDFMFRLTVDEAGSMVSQNVIPSMKHFGGYLPYAFTEQGVSMLSSILRSKKAVLVNIRIMRIFVSLNQYLSTHQELAQKFKELEDRIEHKIGEQDEKIESIINVINQLLLRPSIEVPKAKFRIRGFKK